MRCPQCGTENAPDSRFCGGCGAAVSVSRQARTVKISDDAPIAAPTGRPSTAPHVSYAPPSMPGHDVPQAGVTTRPGGHSAPPRPSGPQVASSPLPGQVGQPHDSLSPTSERPRSSQYAAASHVPDPSMSFSAPARRPIGLIVLVLVVDAGLAAAGALLLAKGLAKPQPLPAPRAEQKSETEPTPPALAPSETASSTPAPAAVAAQVAATQPASEPPSKPEPVIVAARAKTTRSSTVTATPIVPAPATLEPAKSAAAEPPKPAPAAAPIGAPASIAVAAPIVAAKPVAAEPPKAAPAAPATPTVSTPQAEINSAYARSQGAFDRCKGNAPAVGRISIAFHVQPDGTLAHVSPVENTTGNAQLAQCLVAVIAPWRITPFQGSTFPLVRQFNYQ
jgi:hypothetical protein